ncbi:MAG TPA: hypothetical protein VMG60_01195 [Burkholderiaceae bacterium]|nr:hypothetical protein [Burkholderiaceae bacterium]
MSVAILVLGAGDVGSAVAHQVYRAGARVLLCDVERPTHARRGMSFIDALFDGEAPLEGVVARHVLTAPAVTEVWTAGDAIPIVALPEDDVLRSFRFDVVVDATMRRGAAPIEKAPSAPMTIGLGPGFTPGVNCHVAIETQWGDTLGAVLRDRSTAPLAGGPPLLGGVGRERFVFAPGAGRWRTRAAIGQRVRSGDVIGRIADVSIHAPVSGSLRGLTRDDVVVAAGDNVLEVDPRQAPEVFGLGTRPRAVARGVCAALGL